VDIETDTGFGNVLAIYFSTYSAPFPEGTIPYFTESVDPVPTFEAEAVLDYDLDNEEGIHLTGFTDGELTITKSSDGNTITIQFDCNSFEDEKLTG